MGEISKAGAETSGKMLAEAAGFGSLNKLTDEQQQDFRSAASSTKGHMGVEASGKLLAEAAEFEEWDELTDDQRQDFMCAASIIKGQMGVEGHAKVLAAKRGVMGVVGSFRASRDGVSHGPWASSVERMLKNTACVWWWKGVTNGIC